MWVRAERVDSSSRKEASSLSLITKDIESPCGYSDAFMSHGRAGSLHRLPGGPGSYAIGRWLVTTKKS
jgi:hypothetical protein